MILTMPRGASSFKSNPMSSCLLVLALLCSSVDRAQMVAPSQSSLQSGGVMKTRHGWQSAQCVVNRERRKANPFLCSNPVLCVSSLSVIYPSRNRHANCYPTRWFNSTDIATHGAVDRSKKNLLVRGRGSAVGFASCVTGCVRQHRLPTIQGVIVSRPTDRVGVQRCQRRPLLYLLWKDRRRRCLPSSPRPHWRVQAACRCRRVRVVGRRTRGRSAPHVAHRRAPCQRRTCGSSRAVVAAGCP